MNRTPQELANLLTRLESGEELDAEDGVDLSDALFSQALMTDDGAIYSFWGVTPEEAAHLKEVWKELRKKRRKGLN